MSPGLLLRRGAELAGWLLPGVVLALMPKCPLCLAAYVAMATGLSLTATAAGQLREWTIILCLAMPGLLILRQIRRRFFSRPASHRQKCCR